jgi:CheY-like chemotaxis protein
LLEELAMPARVLIVDDDPAVTEVLSLLLEDSGYLTSVAFNGQHALESIMKAPPDVVLLDLQMPVMSGWELHYTLRRHGLGLPIVFMTAGQDAMVEATRHGADGYLSKPFDLDDVLEVVGRFAV